MAAGQSLKFVVEVAANEANRSLAVLSQAFNEAGISAKRSLLNVGSGTKAAAEASGSLEQKIKSLKGEMAAGDRTINFFARSLNGIVPEASAAGQGLRLLADGLIGGLGLGLAIQGVMAVLTLFGEKLKETEKKAAESAKAAKDTAEAWYQLGAAFESAMSKIGAPKKSWQQEQVDSATAATDKQIEEQEKKLRDVTANLNQALNDRDDVGLFDNGAEDRVLAALQEKQTILETLEALKQTREQQRAAAAERAEEAAARSSDSSTAGTFYQEQRRLQEQSREAARKVADAYRKATEELLRAGYVSAERAAEKLRVLAAQFAPKQSAAESLYGIKGTGLGPTAFTSVGFGGNADVASLTTSESVAMGAKILAAEDEYVKRLTEQSQKMTQDIAGSWISALAQMVESTDLSVQSMIKLFAQLAGQMMQQAGFSMGGPIGALAGAFLGRMLPRAHGGWDIPKGYGEVPLIAQGGEKVLSQSTSAKLDALIASNSGTASPMPVTIVAMDGPSLKDFLVRNGTDFNAAVRELARQGR
jgi:hypothetical protein